MNFWKFYLLVYTILAFGYLWYRYIFLVSYNEKSNYGDYKREVSIIIPFYNEKPDLLVSTVLKASECSGQKEIIVIDDGSKLRDGYNALKELQKSIRFKLIRYDENKGKRHAQIIGFNEAKGEIIMTLDSDTILDKMAIVNLIQPFSNKEVGATTGQLEILNSKQNFLTRLISARYWNAFNFERKSQSVLGAIVCCTGPISAYRTSLIKSIMKDYDSQTFMGNKCTYGDDRHLTTLTIYKKNRVVYVKNAIGYTMAMSNLKSFLKQQIRWKKSWLRETYLLSKFMFKNSRTISFEVIFTTLITFFSIFARIGLMITLIFNPPYLIFALLLLTLMGILHSLYILFNKPEYFIYSIIYGFFHAFIVYWTLIFAIITFRDVKWGTR